MNTPDKKESLLDKINSPADLKGLPLESLQQLAKELRHKIIETTSKTGGHLAPSLGTVELTIALHFVFDAPKDKIIWDVGASGLCAQTDYRAQGPVSHPQDLWGGSAGSPKGRRAPTTPSIPDTAVPLSQRVSASQRQNA